MDDEEPVTDWVLDDVAEAVAVLVTEVVLVVVDDEEPVPDWVLDDVADAEDDAEPVAEALLDAEAVLDEEAVLEDEAELDAVPDPDEELEGVDV